MLALFIHMHILYMYIFFCIIYRLRRLCIFYNVAGSVEQKPFHLEFLWRQKKRNEIELCWYFYECLGMHQKSGCFPGWERTSTTIRFTIDIYSVDEKSFLCKFILFSEFFSHSFQNNIKGWWLCSLWWKFIDVPMLNKHTHIFDAHQRKPPFHGDDKFLTLTKLASAFMRHCFWKRIMPLHVIVFVAFLF